MKPKLLCLHGFMGSGEQFNFLKNHFTIIAPDLNNFVHLSIDDIVKKLMVEIDFSTTHILGYSFGSRLGLQIFSHLKMKFPSLKILCLAGHMGLKESERLDRLVFENEMIAKIRGLDEVSFFKFWNQFELFKYDRPTPFIKYDKQILELYFLNYGLSKQPYLLDRLKKFSNDIKFVYGDLDTKYKNYAMSSLDDFYVQILAGAGHRLLQYPDAIKKITKDFYNV